MNNNKILNTIILLLIILPTFSLAIDPPPYDPFSELKNSITTEGTKTRTELTLYVDRKVAETTNTFETRGQQFIDENFEQFDKSIQALAVKVQVQFTIAIILSIIVANSIWWWIRRTLESKKNPVPKEMKRDTHNQPTHGIITSEYQKQLDKEDNNLIKQTIFEEKGDNKVPVTKTIDEISLLLQEKREEKARIEREKAKKKAEIEAEKIWRKEQKQENSLFNKLKIARQIKKKEKEEAKLQKEKEALEKQKTELEKKLSEIKEKTEFEKKIGETRI